MSQTSTWVALAALVASATAGGCGGKKDRPPAADKAAAKPDAKAELAAVAAQALPDVNGKIPEELRGKLEFTAVLGERDRHVAVQPKGWESGAQPSSIRPPDAAGLGFMTSYSTDSNCDGKCEPKDWAAAADKIDFAPLTGQDFTVLKDEKSPTGRLVVARTIDHTYVVATQWKEGAKRYFACHATLDQELAAAAPAFEAACRAMRVVAWD